ncbi:MAG: hypothetical protein PHF14_03590, partial [Verrucomicrobiota bacterium]|nr:hypothetical protein [Verrucomicrobiota bacterium]
FRSQDVSVMAPWKRSTTGRAAARSLEVPCEVGGPQWVGLGIRLEDVKPADDRGVVVASSNQDVLVMAPWERRRPRRLTLWIGADGDVGAPR